jgi:hypothetical protein
MVTVSLDSLSCEVTLFDPVSVVIRDATRQTKGLYSLKYVGALWNGLAYLSRYNSGWFCHNQEYDRVVALQAYVLHIGCAYGPAVACGGSDPRVGMKGKRLLRNNRWMFQACEFGLPLQG